MNVSFGGNYKFWTRALALAVALVIVGAFGAFLFGHQSMVGVAEAQEEVATSSIHAFKFSDLDEDGVYEPEDGETGVSDWEICIYELSFEDEPFSDCETTDETGWVWWMDLDHGTYELEEEGREGWRSTTDEEVEVEVGAGESEEVEFGNHKILGSIHAFKFNDFDGDEEYEPEDGEVPVEGWEICLGEGFNGHHVIDCETTDADGWVWWMDLEPQSYIITEEERDGWFPTTDDEVHVSAHEEGEDFDDFDEGGVEIEFGNRQRAIHAFKFRDFDQDGYFNEEDGDTPIEGWEICLYRYVGEEPPEFIDCEITDENGWVWWMGLEPDVYFVSEEEREDWFPTTELYEVDGLIGYWVELGDDVEEVEFGNGQNAVHAFKFYDVDEDEEFDPDPEDEDGDEPIEGWNMCLYRVFFDFETEEEHRHLIGCEDTNEEGWVWWMPLEEGQYVVVEEEREHWFPTTHGDGEEYVWVEELDGEVVVEFGNTTQAIHAFKFHDIDDNGYFDPEEGDDVPIEGWKICLYQVLGFDEDGPILEPIDCQFTDENGWVWWKPLAEGEYFVEEETREGWFPTTHEEEDGLLGEEVELGDGDSEEIWFGNYTPFGKVHAYKFNDENGNGEQDEGEEGISGWEICLYTDGEELELIGCETTDEDGWVWWMLLEPGEYLVEEQGRENWENTTENNPEDVEVDEG